MAGGWGRIAAFSGRLALALLPALIFGLYARVPGLVFLAYIALVPWVLLYTDDRRPDVSVLYYVFAAWVTWVAMHPQVQQIGGWYAPLVMGTGLYLFWIPFAPLLRAIHRRLRLPRALTVAVVWTAVEWARTTFTFGHFELYLLGYSQARFPLLVQIADVTGAYGVSFLVAAFNGLIADVVFTLRDAAWKPRALASRRVIGSAVAVAAGFFLSAAYGAYRLASSTETEGPRVALVQPCGIHRRGTALGDHLDLAILTERLVPPNAVDLIVWPENAVFDNIRRPGVYLDDLGWLSARKGAPMLVGGMTWPDFNPAKRLNSAFLIDDRGTIVSEYVKQALFPWTESVPLDGFLGRVAPALQRFHRRLIRASWGAVARAVPGSETTILRLPWKGSEIPFAAPVCFENGYAPIPAEAARNGARFIVNITSESNLGGAVQEQLLRITTLRAIETRVPYVRAANTGISAIIDSNGFVRRILLGEKGRPISDKGVLLMAIPLAPPGGPTLYVRSRDAFAIGCVGATLLMLVWGFVRGRRRAASIAVVAVLVTATAGCGGVTAPGTDASGAAASLSRGRELVARTLYAPALRELAAACADEEVCAQALPLAAESFEKHRSIEDAADFFGAVAERHPMLAAEALGYRGYFREQLGMLDESDQDYRRSLELKPSARVWGFFAAAHLLKGDAAGAVTACREAAALEPGEIAWRVLLVRALRLAGQTDEAVTLAESIVVEKPEISEAWGELGWAHWARGNEAAARVAFTREASLDRTTTEARFMLARFALRAGDVREAERLQREMEAIQAANLAGKRRAE